MTLLSKIQDTIEAGQPFFINDLMNEGFSYDTVKTMLAKYVKDGDICRYSQDAYYIPKNHFWILSPSI